MEINETFLKLIKQKVNFPLFIFADFTDWKYFAIIFAGEIIRREW